MAAQNSDSSGMDLETFVSDTLVSIIVGVNKAQIKLGEAGSYGMINPEREPVEYSYPPRDVEFDIAVTVESSAKGSASGGVQISVVRFGASGEVTDKDVAVSRVKFSVPVSFPWTTRS